MGADRGGSSHWSIAYLGLAYPPSPIPISFPAMPTCASRETRPKTSAGPAEKAIQTPSAGSSASELHRDVSRRNRCGHYCFGGYGPPKTHPPNGLGIKTRFLRFVDHQPAVLILKSQLIHRLCR